MWPCWYLKNSSFYNFFFVLNISQMNGSAVRAWREITLKHGSPSVILTEMATYLRWLFDCLCCYNRQSDKHVYTQAMKLPSGCSAESARISAKQPKNITYLTVCIIIFDLKTLFAPYQVLSPHWNHFSLPVSIWLILPLYGSSCILLFPGSKAELGRRGVVARETVWWSQQRSTWGFSNQASQCQAQEQTWWRNNWTELKQRIASSQSHTVAPASISSVVVL